MSVNIMENAFPAFDFDLSSYTGWTRAHWEYILARMTYGHPVYDQQSVAAQRCLAGLNTPVLAYAGAYHGWGFHEDGCRSGIEAARALGVDW